MPDATRQFVFPLPEKFSEIFEPREVRFADVAVI
jgi:hypothetical protein